MAGLLKRLVVVVAAASLLGAVALCIGLTTVLVVMLRFPAGGFMRPFEPDAATAALARYSHSDVAFTSSDNLTIRGWFIDAARVRVEKGLCRCC